MALNPWGGKISTIGDIQASFGHRGTTPSGRRSVSGTTSPYFGAGQGDSGGSGGGGSMGAGTMFGGSGEMDMEDYLKLADWQQNVNQATRGSVLGYYDPLSTELGGLSSYYQPRLREQPYNESSIGMIQGQARDTLAAQRNSQLRQLQDMMAKRGGAVGYGAMNELEARYGKQLGDIMRDVRIQAIDKNRSALQSSLQAEAGLAAQKQALAQAQAQAWYNLPASQELPKLGQQAQTNQYDPDTSPRSLGGGGREPLDLYNDRGGGIGGLSGVGWGQGIGY